MSESRLDVRIDPRDSMSVMRFRYRALMARVIADDIRDADVRSYLIHAAGEYEKLATNLQKDHRH